MPECWKAFHWRLLSAKGDGLELWSEEVVDGKGIVRASRDYDDLGIHAVRPPAPTRSIPLPGQTPLYGP